MLPGQFGLASVGKSAGRQRAIFKAGRIGYTKRQASGFVAPPIASIVGCAPPQPKNFAITNACGAAKTHARNPRKNQSTRSQRSVKPLETQGLLRLWGLLAAARRRSRVPAFEVTDLPHNGGRR